MALRQRWQSWWSAIQQWIAGRWRSSPGACPEIAVNNKALTSSSSTPSSALLIQLNNLSCRRSDSRHRCSTQVSARAWRSEQRVIDLLSYHAARHTADLTPEQMQQRLNNIRAHTPD
ncbi:hypothetical protein [Permianibacter aggregans]|uniref:Uncharacterized protein n=2 Tax=Permianibacter aggregans TaxID=1510150 RepID=A0A4R6UJ84_9GAMM|nr:hypothetical protein [Permianibacter aggregans]TDQ45479.1 hypothetical protein EV696_12056 [Permianibacter aggregans]